MAKITGWKKIYEHAILVTYQNKEANTELGVQKIMVGTTKRDYVWRISKSIPHRLTKLIILGDRQTKKEALKFARKYMQSNRQ